MFVVIITSVIAFILTFLESKGKAPGGMKWGFVMITILGAIHYDYGNDYMSYFNVYRDIADTVFDYTSIMSGDVYREPGWVILNYLFKYLGGFYVMVATLNIIQNVIIYKFIRREVPKVWQPIGVFIYLYTVSFYLMSFSMMRQWFVVCVFLGLWHYIKQKKWLLPFVVLYLCHFVHGSSIVLLPFAFWGFLPIKNGKVYAILFASFIIALWISGSWVNELFEQTIMFTETESFVERYQNSDDTVGSFGLGALIQYIPLFVGIYYLLTATDDSDSNKRLVLLSILGFSIAPLNMILPAVGRLGIYFSIFQMGSVYLIYGSIKNQNLRIVLLSLFVLIISYDYFLFFSNPIWTAHYSNFHTIFEQL